jgi:hypothetical protein
MFAIFSRHKRRRIFLIFETRSNALKIDKDLNCGRSSMVERQPSKLNMPVRSRSPAPFYRSPLIQIFIKLRYSCFYIQLLIDDG